MNLSKYLESKKMSQAEFARVSKINPVYICLYLKGKCLPSLPNLDKIIKATNGLVGLEDFLTDEKVGDDERL